VRHQTYGYLPSRRASLPLDRYQIMLLCDRGTCVCVCVNNLPKVKAERPRLEPATF